MRSRAAGFAVAQAALLAVLFVAASVSGASGQGPVLVMPFSDPQRAGRLSWVGEGAALLVSDELSRLGAHPIPRADRVQALERLQLPSSVALGEATVIRVGQLAGASEIVVGVVTVEGGEVVITARRIRVDVGRRSAAIVERGPLADLFTICDRIARQIRPEAGDTRPAPARPPLGAFESFVKGLLAETPASQAGAFEAALVIWPAYDTARLALWRARTEQGAHVAALNAVLPISPRSPEAPLAQLLAGVSEMHAGRLDGAFTRLRTLAESGAGAAAWNDAGVAALRRGEAAGGGRATYYFSKAVELAKESADFCFNLGYAYWLERDAKAAVYWLREAVRRAPTDGPAHYVLGVSLGATGNQAEGERERALAAQLNAEFGKTAARPGPDAVRAGLERIATDLSPGAGPLLDELLSTSGQRDQRELAAFHLERGRRLVAEGHDAEASAELGRVVFLAPYSGEAHRLLGKLYLRGGRTREGLDELKIAVWSDDTAEARLDLAEAYLQARDVEGARSEIRKVLAKDPASPRAQALLAKIGAAPSAPPSS